VKEIRDEEVELRGIGCVKQVGLSLGCSNTMGSSHNGIPNSQTPKIFKVFQSFKCFISYFLGRRMFFCHE